MEKKRREWPFESISLRRNNYTENSFENDAVSKSRSPHTWDGDTCLARKKNRTRLCLWQRRRAKKNDNTEIFLGLSNLFIMILILKDNRRTRLCNPMEIPVSHDALQPVSDEHEKFSHSGRIYDEAKSWYYDVFHYRYSTIHIFQELT